MGSVLRDKSFAFAVSVLQLGNYLDSIRQYALKDQLVRSGTSIGANIKEARNAQGTKDMISKLSIALKEADETEYWIELIKTANIVDAGRCDEMTRELNEIIAMLVSSIKTLKYRINENMVS